VSDDPHYFRPAIEARMRRPLIRTERECVGYPVHDYQLVTDTLLGLVESRSWRELLDLAFESKGVISKYSGIRS
jgi:hypothetical protein